MAAKKSGKKKSAGKKAEPRKPLAKKSAPRKAARSTAKASSKPAPKKAAKAQAAPAKPKKAASARPKKAASARPKTAPPQKAAAKKAAPKKAAPKKAAASQRPRSTANGVHRRDRAGHLDPKYAAELRAKSAESRETTSGDAFLRGAQSADVLAEELGEEAVETMTTGEDEGNESRDEFAEEEIGGPFVESSGNKEFADDSDESNPDDATREPFPKT
jgi:hypothetical protein